MPENEFEKHVQDRLDELKLRPSESVWRAVELDLKKKKRRRVVFFMFLLAGLGLFGYSGYFLFNDTKPEIAEQQPKGLPAIPKPSNEINDKNNTHPLQENKTLINKENINNETDDLPEDTELIASPNNRITQKTRIGIAQPIETRIVKKEKTTPVSSKNQNLSNKQKAIVDKEQEKELAQNNDRKQKSNRDLKEEVVIVKATNETSVLENSIAGDHIAQNDQPVEKAIINSDQEKDATIAEANETLHDEKRIAEQKKKSGLKLKWGAEVSGGITSNRTDALSLSTTQAFADAAMLNNSVPITGANPNPVRTPSEIKGGSAYKAGVVVETKLSTRSSISSGLRYSYLSEKINVGDYRNVTNWYNSYSNQSMAGGVYRGAQEKEYTNKYHFIELPVTYHLHLNKSAKTPILWNAGISVAYLAATNALVYDSTMGGVYYKEADVFNKWHFNLNTGFSFRFGNKMQWSVGPELSLDMTRLVKQELYTKKRYLLYGGLSAKLFLPQRKK